MPVSYKDNRLNFIQGDRSVDLLSLAQKTDEPFYLYDMDGAVQRLKFFQQEVHPAEVFFSLKCNNHPFVVRSLLKNQAGLDIVSGGELNLSLKLGCDPKKIVFSGVGKTKKELELALKSGIFQINVESLEELDRLGVISSHLKISAPTAIRLNPHVHLDTHPFIQTGGGDHKFGIEEHFLPQCIEIFKKHKKYLKFQGLAVHIGSQGLSIEPLVQAVKKTKQIYERLCRDGHSLITIDIGGGVGIDYRTQNLDDDLQRIKLYGKEIKNIFHQFEGRVLCEPGRIIMGRFGWLFGEVQYVKKTSRRHFAILNTGMNHLIRPVLYQAFHEILPLVLSGNKKQVYTVAGPICESGDVLARDRELNILKSGDWVAFCDTGAYGAVMAQKYNLNPWPKELAFSCGKQCR